jgi:ubiquinone/menaquinone biosynthesis C-methylase UbiE/DNA-binding transcriptional ArsR family regulator
MQSIEDSVEILKAAGEPTRLRLLALFASGELSVKDLTEILDQSQPRISRHLRLLHEAGLIQRQAEGAWAYFRLADKGDAAELTRHIIGHLDMADAQILADRDALAKVRACQREKAAAYFSKIAPSWDLLRSLHVEEAAVEAAILAQCADTRAETMLDLGTGTGRMLELLAHRFKNGIGVDLNKEMIAVARAKLSAANVTNATVRAGDITELEEYRAAADLVVIHQVLHYFDDPGRVIGTASATLKPGGRMLIVDFAPHELEFLRTEHAHRRLGLSRANMEEWAEAADLQVCNCQEFPFAGQGRGLKVCLWTLTNNMSGI